MLVAQIHAILRALFIPPSAKVVVMSERKVQAANEALAKSSM
jgi:hypothetical protein